MSALKSSSSSFPGDNVARLFGAAGGSTTRSPLFGSFGDRRRGGSGRHVSKLSLIHI